MKRAYWYLVVCGLALSGCRLKERESELARRAQELDRKEQQLMLRAQQLDLKEKDLASREKALTMPADTTSDSTGVYNPDLVGRWAVQMRCTETTCAGSAVGDIKNEQWAITYDNRKILAQATANNKVVRVYTGVYDGNALALVARQDSTSMTVRLVAKSPTSLEGQREISREGSCRIVYVLDLTKL